MFTEETAGQDQSDNPIPNADEISVETLINLLVKKGIITSDELFMFEGKLREEKHQLKHANYVKIKNYHDRGRFPRLNKFMSRYRWSRRLGTFLFGWKWKKFKNH